MPLSLHTHHLRVQVKVHLHRVLLGLRPIHNRTFGVLWDPVVGVVVVNQSLEITHLDLVVVFVACDDRVQPHRTLRVLGKVCQ